MIVGSQRTNEINERIRVVYVANPPIEVTHVEFIEQAGVGALKLFTTPDNKDFFLTSAFLLLNQTVPAGVGITPLCALDITFNGSSIKVLLQLQRPQRLAGAESVTIAYPIPIKVDRDTNITLRVTAGDLATQATATITGFTVEP